MANFIKDFLGVKKKKKNRSPSYGENSSYPTGVPPGSHPGYPVSYPVGTTAPPVHGLQQLHISDIGGQAAAGYPPGYGATSQPTGYYPQHQGQAGFTQYPSGAPHPSYTATSVNYRPTSTTTNMGGCLSSPKPSQQMPPPSAGIQGPVGLPPQNNPLSDNNIQLQMPSSPGASSTTGGIVVRAIYDFQARVDDDLTFKKGDKMHVIGDSENCDWWMAKHVATGQIGYIPSNYVTKDDNNPESQEWWFSVDRREADKQLMLHGNPKGTFLIRASSDKKCYALSILDYNDVTQEFAIKHYRVRTMDNNGCYISAKRTFRSLLDLIAHYKSKADGLCTQLTKACPKEPEPVPFKDIEVERSQLRLDKRLGAGNFGEVFAGKWRGHVDVAVKTLKPGSMSTEAFLDEAKIMHKLRHRKLVQLMGVCTLTDPIYIITELMVNGSLLDYLRQDEGRTLKLPILIDMAAQIANGMEYLETKNYVHRDLRAANILVGENNVVKVADFGLARFTDSETDTVYMAHEATKFPIKWTAPEAAFERKFSVKSDVWSYGILLYELITYGRIPYPDIPSLIHLLVSTPCEYIEQKNQDVLENLKQGYRMPLPSGLPEPCPEQYYGIMTMCWAAQSEDRPTFEFLYSLFDDFSISATEKSYKNPNDV